MGVGEEKGSRIRAEEHARDSASKEEGMERSVREWGWRGVGGTEEEGEIGKASKNLLFQG